jgi:hypothetical protein
MNGILLRSEQQLEPGSKCSVMILLGHYLHALPISAEGVVIRSQDGLLAICFDAIGIEASEEFQSMILFHSERPEQCLQGFRQAGPN